MTRRIPMPHLVILIPGIMGSVLQRNGRDLWALSGQALSELLLSAGTAVNNLELHEEDLSRDMLSDQIVATRLIDKLHNIPGLIKGAGYATIQQLLCASFDLTPGDIHHPQPQQNFFPFPYDWRRDIRVASRQLQAFATAQLPAWQEYSGAQQAGLVLIAHSMGGLVARHYIELLGGADRLEVLYTLGTPHRGALNALDVISNGMALHNGSLMLPLRDLTRVLRSFSSIYQLLPIYPVIQHNAELLRVTEAGSIPNLDLQRATAARRLLLDIADAALSSSRAGHRPPGSTVPVIGIRQETAQYAVITESGTVALSKHPLPGLSVADGDGTVPHFSAIPIEVQERQLGTERFVVEHHGWLTNGEASLRGLVADLANRIDRSSYPSYSDAGPGQEGIGVQVEDFYQLGEPVTISAQLGGLTTASISLVAQITRAGTHTGQRIALSASGTTHSATVEGLPAGLYELVVGPQFGTSSNIHPVTTAFEVAPE